MKILSELFAFHIYWSGIQLLKATQISGITLISFFFLLPQDNITKKALQYGIQCLLGMNLFYVEVKLVHLPQPIFGM